MPTVVFFDCPIYAPLKHVVWHDPVKMYPRHWSRNRNMTGLRFCHWILYTKRSSHKINSYILLAFLANFLTAHPKNQTLSLGLVVLQPC